MRAIGMRRPLQAGREAAAIQAARVSSWIFPFSEDAVQG